MEERTSDRTTLDEFYGQMICAHMSGLPDHFVPDIGRVREALDLSEADFQRGMDWAIRKGAITLQPNAPI